MNKYKELLLGIAYCSIVALLTVTYCNIRNGLNVDYNVQINKINDSLSITETDIPE